MGRLAFHWVKKPGDAQLTLLYIPRFRLFYSQLFTYGCMYICTLSKQKTEKERQETPVPVACGALSRWKRLTLLCLCIPIPTSYRTDLVMVDLSYVPPLNPSEKYAPQAVMLVCSEVKRPNVPVLSRDISRYIFTYLITNTKRSIQSTVDVTSPIQFGRLCFKVELDSSTSLNALSSLYEQFYDQFRTVM
jgi:hypothetical protein